MNAKRHNSRALQLARLRKGWTLKKLSAITGLSIAACGHILAGKRSGARSVNLIGEALGLTADVVWPDMPGGDDGGGDGGMPIPPAAGGLRVIPISGSSSPTTHENRRRAV